MPKTAKKEDDSKRMFDNGRAWFDSIRELVDRMKAAQDPAADIALIDRDSLDEEHHANFTLNWFLQDADGNIEEFDTEEQAAAAQRAWRAEHHLDPATGEAESEDDIRREIEEGPLSVQVRDGWRSPGAPSDGAEEYEILLSTGGPALRIFGEINNGSPTSAELQAQDWFKPWTAVPDIDQDVLIEYASNFYFED